MNKKKKRIFMTGAGKTSLTPYKSYKYFKNKYWGETVSERVWSAIYRNAEFYGCLRLKKVGENEWRLSFDPSKVGKDGLPKRNPPTEKDYFTFYTDFNKEDDHE